MILSRNFRRTRTELQITGLEAQGGNMTEDDDKKEILSSDEKGAAKSTLGGAVEVR